MLILGIESSCDETAAAVVKDGVEILSSIIASQIDLHRPWGGVVPELASREHLEKINPVVQEAIENAGIARSDLDAVAVTQGPGLVGSLLVGVCYAKALAYSLRIPLIGVNHIEGHVYSVVFDHEPIRYPALALIVSGGHTNIFHIPTEGSYKVVSRTRDDAAGEAFDKVAKMLGLGYPGGPEIERLAATGDPRKLRLPQAKISDGRPDLSFSGLKTAVTRHLREAGIRPALVGEDPPETIRDVAASFQEAVVKALVNTLENLSNEFHPRTLIVAGGVACNTRLREEAAAVGVRRGVPVLFPSKHLSTDNAAMIAAAAHFRLKNGLTSDLRMTADISMRLQNFENDDEELRRKKVKYRL